MFLVKILVVFLLMEFYDVNHTHALRDTERAGIRRTTRITKPCPNPHFRHGRFRLKHKSSAVKYICAQGYTLVGNKYATCENGQWDEPAPICVKPGCPLTIVENALNVPSYNNSWVIFFCLPGFDMVGSGTVYCDGIQWNGTFPKCVATKTPPELSCDFESPDICGWKQDVKHDFDWKRLRGSTPSSFVNTGPKYDHTLGGNNGSSFDGYYMYIESTAKEVNQTARLISPIYDGELAKNGCFSFYYHMNGITMGGLKVYQKPDSLSLHKLLVAPKEDKQKYLLFEKWGNQFDFWYRNVTNLTDFNEDFQIVIEGIRGESYLSDIAIDDVAILQGENCTIAMKTAETPPPFSQSCAGRCRYDALNLLQETNVLCSCNIYCTDKNNCCPDFVEACYFGPNDFDDTYSDLNSDDKPQTQKLVGLTTPVTSTTVSKSTTTIKPVTSTTNTTPKVTTVTTTATTKSVTTTTTTTKRTTVIPTLVFKSTTVIYNATGILKKDNKTEVKPVVSTAPTFVPPVRTTKLRVVTPTTTVKPTTKVVRTTKRIDADEKAKMEKEQRIEAETERLLIKKPENKQSSGVNTAIAVIIGIALCACAAFLIHTARGARGREILARMRGRITSDPEVRYLSAHEDD